VQRESYLHGNSGRPLIGKTIGTLLDEVTATDGSREAPVVAHQNIRSTRPEFKSRSDAFVRASASRGASSATAIAPTIAQRWHPRCELTKNHSTRRLAFD
jgi:fatty-acyl-CoA synthase